MTRTYSQKVHSIHVNRQIAAQQYQYRANMNSLAQSRIQYTARMNQMSNWTNQSNLQMRISQQNSQRPSYSPSNHSLPPLTSGNSSCCLFSCLLNLINITQDPLEREFHNHYAITTHTLSASEATSLGWPFYKGQKISRWAPHDSPLIRKAVPNAKSSLLQSHAPSYNTLANGPSEQAILKYASENWPFTKFQPVDPKSTSHGAYFLELRSRGVFYQFFPEFFRVEEKKQLYSSLQEIFNGISLELKFEGLQIDYKTRAFKLTTKEGASYSFIEPANTERGAQILEFCRFVNYCAYYDPYVWTPKAIEKLETQNVTLTRESIDAIFHHLQLPQRMYCKSTIKPSEFVNKDISIKYTKIDVDDFDIVFVPIEKELNKFSLLQVNVQKKQFVYYDPTNTEFSPIENLGEFFLKLYEYYFGNKNIKLISLKRKHTNIHDGLSSKCISAYLYAAIHQDNDWIKQGLISREVLHEKCMEIASFLKRQDAANAL